MRQENKSQLKAAVYDPRPSYTLLITSDAGNDTFRLSISAFWVHNAIFVSIALLAMTILIAFSYYGLLVNYSNSRQVLYQLQGSNKDQREKLASLVTLSQSVEEKMVYVDLLETKILKLIETDGDTSNPAISQIDARLKDLDTQGLFGYDSSVKDTYLQYYSTGSIADALDITADLDNVAEKLAQKEILIASKEKSFEKLETTWVTNSDFAQCYPDFAPCSGRISDYMGYRTYPRAAFHKGIDIANNSGTPIHAAGRGTIVLAGWNGDYGYCVIIDHGYGYRTLYGHNSKLLVKVGDKVDKGDLIAKMGTTGYSTGNHSHFEVHENGKIRNPLDFIGAVPRS